MTCYQRHLGWLFVAVDRPYEKADRQEIHETLIRMLDLPADAHCPEVWAAIKATYGIDTKRESGQLAADLAAALR